MAFLLYHGLLYLGRVLTVLKSHALRLMDGMSCAMALAFLAVVRMVLRMYFPRQRLLSFPTQVWLILLSQARFHV